MALIFKPKLPKEKVQDCEIFEENFVSGSASTFSFFEAKFYLKLWSSDAVLWQKWCLRLGCDSVVL